LLGSLPTSLHFGGQDWEIRSDFRNILCIFEAYEDTDLDDKEKILVCLMRMYVHFDELPKHLVQDAYEAAVRFIGMNQHQKQSASPQVFDWIKDEQLIFPAVNAVAGQEVRALPYLHWWTFMGYLESVDSDSLFSYVVSLRRKKSQGKKLEKHEQEFIRQNRELMSMESHEKPLSAEEQMQRIFDEMVQGNK